MSEATTSVDGHAISICSEHFLDEAIGGKVLEIRYDTAHEGSREIEKLSEELKRRGYSLSITGYWVAYKIKVTKEQ